MAANFRKGADAAKEASKGGNFARTEYLKMDDNEEVILRFLTDADEWVVVDQHQMVPTKPQPAGHDGNWPERMGAVCRNDPAFKGIYSDCYICDHIVDGKKVKKPGARTWALACMREEVVGDGSDALGGADMKGKVVGIRDKTRTVTIPAKDGQPEKEVTEKDIVVVNLGFKNFFSILQGFAGRYGTVLDRDYWVKRSGTDTSTTYQVVPLDPIPTKDPDDESKRVTFDLRDPRFMARYETSLTLEEVVSERADDEFYARFFDRRLSIDKDGNIVKTGETAPPPAAPEADVDADRMQELANRVKTYGGKGAEAPAEAADEAPAPEDTSTPPPAEEPTPEPAGAPTGGGMVDFDS